MTHQPSDVVKFRDRRSRQEDESFHGIERRQFTNSYEELCEGAQELGKAIDQYKLHNRRRYITYDEMYNIMVGLGYQKVDATSPSDFK